MFEAEGNGHPFDEVVARVRAAADEGEEYALVPSALEAALAADLDDRAWALITLGGVLAVLGHYEEALDALRGSIELRSSEEARVAALLCAAAIRCDQGELEEASRIAHVVENTTGDPKLLRLLARVFLRTADLNSSAELQEHARRFLERANLEEAFGRA